MSYEALVIEDLRLGVLELLEEDADYSHNEAILQRLLSRRRAHSVSCDMLRSQLAWLADQGLVTLDQSADLWTAKLTRRGEDVALGRGRVPGIARPLP